MSLFTKLIDLHSRPKPLEDYFTEIIAHFFSLNTNLLIKFLQEYSIITNDAEYIEVYISTQKSYNPLEEHVQGSRPDILIEMSDGFKTDVIFIESKIGSPEGDDQIKRYSEQLEKLSYYNRRSLIYITRDYESKEDSANSTQGVSLYPMRWYQFYQFLDKENSSDSLVTEILTFMRKNNMSQNKQLSSIDLLSMSNFRKTLRFMEETLSEEVSDRFNKIFSCSTKLSAASLTQFKNHGRYIIRTDLSGNHFWAGVGYFDMNPDNYVDYPYIGVILEVSRNYEHRQRIIEVFEELAEDKIWEGVSLHDSNAWSKIYCRKNIKDILFEEDHLSTIKRCLLDSLVEVEKVINTYPDLPWKGTSS